MNILDLKRKLLPMSGPQSGGGSSATSTTTTGLPAWAQGYAQDTLAKQAALSDQPYQAYGGSRIQGFDPLQQQAQQGAAGMGTSNITGQAAGIAGGIAGQAAGTSYAPTQFGTQSFTGQGTADQYMNPYMQNVVDIQKREAQRQSGIQGTQQAGQATQAGAFGGSRDAIMRAERERNLGQQMGDIQAQGSNAAFQQAQQQFNVEQNRGLSAQQAAEQSRQYGAGLGMQGLQTGLQAAGQLGNLGQQQFQQGMDVNKLQAAYGAQRQAMGQQGLSQAYQDFLAQKQYPQTQLSNMASMLRGLPIGSTQTTSGTPSSPSTMQQLGSLGSMAYGLSQFYADGGAVSSFADGGSVDSQQNIESIVHKLSDQQLMQAEQAAKTRGDVEQLQIIGMEKAARASMKRGIGAAPVDMAKMLPTTESMARGGIVAFGAGGDTEDEDAGETEAQDYMSKSQTEDDETEGLPQAANPDLAKSMLADQQGSISALQGMKYKTQTPAERLAEFKTGRELLSEGVDSTDREGIRADIKRMQEEGTTDLKRSKGLAAIQAGAAMLQGNDPMRGLAAGASTFSEAYGSAIKANQAKNQALQNMKINLAESQRKEQMGLNREAIAFQDQARKDRDAAQKFEVDRLRSLGVLQGNVARSARGTVAKPPAPMKLPEQLGAAEIEAATNPTDKAAQTKLAALRRAVASSKSSFSVADIGGVRAGIEQGKVDTAAAATTSKTNAGINALVEKGKLLDPDYQKALATGDTAGMEAAKDKMYKSIESRQKGAAPATPTAKPAAVKTPSVADIAGAPKGSKIGNMIPGKGHEVLDSSGKLIGYAQ